jgi:hypothetical protein
MHTYYDISIVIGRLYLHRSYIYFDVVFFSAARGRDLAKSNFEDEDTCRKLLS